MQEEGMRCRGKLYIETHKIKGGSYVNDATKAIGEQIEVGPTQSTTDESEISPNDVVSRVFGPKHSGRESQLQGTLNALEACMIMKEGKIPDKLASLFLSQPNDVGSEPKSSLHARGSFGGSNLNSQSNI
ncbi:hypothetical protein SESBI_39585 [Sesbania bispinosa]|nr:hypothetical protein SESBI_39585 [Sesbania bispinosa]